MKHINDFIKVFWAVGKWIILVLVATGISTAVILLGLLGAITLMEKIDPDLVGLMQAWSIILGTVVPLMVFIYCAYLAANRAHQDLVKATEEINRNQKD